MTGWEDTIWLTEQERVDRDNAVFGELSFDITEKLTATGGVRYFEAENSLKASSASARASAAAAGTARRCAATWPFREPSPARTRAIPRTGCRSSTRGHGAVQEPRQARRREGHDRQGQSGVQVHDEPWSTRPGRAATGRAASIARRLPPYLADFLTNYEIGWKTTWAGNRLRFNGALFSQEWEDFQFSFLGENGLTKSRTPTRRASTASKWTHVGGRRRPRVRRPVSRSRRGADGGLLRSRSGDLRADHELPAGVDPDPDTGIFEVRSRRRARSCRCRRSSRAT